MRFGPTSLVLVIAFSLPVLSQQSAQQSAPKNGGDFSNVAQPIVKVPEGVILVKGAWSSASDSSTPVPEGGSVVVHLCSLHISLLWQGSIGTSWRRKSVATLWSWC